MKKVSTVGAKPSKKISQQKLTVGLDLEIATAGTACWTNPARYNWSNASGAMRKRCGKSLASCRTAGSLWKSGRIRPGSVACSASWGMK